MSFYSSASGASTWRGYGYYKNDHILSRNKLSDTVFSGTVKGGSTVYEVTIDTEHPKRSTCTCPHAEGTRRICKHKVALFFSFFPKEAEAYYRAVLEAEQEAEDYAAEMENRLLTCVRRMSKDELREALLQLLWESPDYLLDRFLYEYEQ